MKISQHESKSGFFLSLSHIGWDSGLSSKIGIIPMKSGWLYSLYEHNLPLIVLKFNQKMTHTVNLKD